MRNVALLDVTLRDGGYVNGHTWSRQQASTVVSACATAHIPFCEVGYYRPRRHAADGADRPTSCCPDDHLRTLCAANPTVTVTVMAHARDVHPTDYRRLADLGVGMVRLPALHAILADLTPHVEAARAAGLMVAVNLIRVSELSAREVAAAARLAEQWQVNAFYLADSNGSLFPEQVDRLVGVAGVETSVPLGFHAHDGLSLAFINSLSAVEAGCRYLDASLGGMGKGGGNLALELIAGYLRARSQAPHAMTPLAHTAAEVLKPWRDGVLARCESIAGGLLDLNTDTIRDRHDQDQRELFTLVDAISG
ncbi:beta/alpha barrel domain-containing protein [Micromonospora sagamiensis]|uniref:4-hydroxy 2-oxovalerate aldolase n=1 Tax=Micromonospora sagamiensis TaxID=47875 RepID=A0A562WIS8_9ACTN|nr:hypothetical protein [Micromonospora sagamiensis]TWJ29444.1 4-hydroxy 2-oxovalerate aldolase [Micromonospora sagamiensis]BCL17527.1 hypothetical protein GCM10017556_52660 [Micromonospora sagamiensis]